ncbi:glutaminyl-peptide cyclotransferase isoform X2 [Magnolia sinica]|uniref:glutaminyl-peptide cyclotransferase isoform X2 n=1 Tax=Magnolia sinica TaxID=86752 RepID=UPI0026591D53|nr:glutaminyl-peptide cyclotransferase isoform X2 [Magnolia sinica]
MARGTLKKRKIPNQAIVVSPSMASSTPIKGLSLSSRFTFRTSFLPSVLLLFCVAALFYATSKITFGASSSEIYTFDIVNEFPHDPKAFTQGLLYGGNDTLFESTGLYRESSVRQVLLHTGKVQAIHQMDGSYFGEGLTLLGERLFQVTWLKKTGFIYDRHDLSKWKMFTHQMNDGWGLATDGKVIFGSDGTSTLYQLDPQSLKVLRKVTVTYKGREIFYLNELEYVNGEVWANVWQSDCIARISHQNGVVLGWILLHKLRQDLLSSRNTNIDVLNGIAWDREKDRLFVTGKWWPKLYEIKLHLVKGPYQGSIEEYCMPRRY